MVQSAACLRGGEAVSLLLTPQSFTLKRRDLGGERSAASDEDILSDGSEGNEGDCATRCGADTSQHKEKHEAASGGGAAFNIRRAPLRMKEEKLPRKTIKGPRHERHHKVNLK